MAALLGLVAFTVCAVIGAASWGTEAVSPSLVQREHAAAFTAWAGFSGLAGLAGLATGDEGHPATLALLLLASLAAITGVVGAARPATLTTGLAPAAAEAALIAGSVVGLFWAAAGSPASPDGPVLVWVTLAVLDLITAAVIVRIPVVSPSAMLDRRYRPIVATAVVALGGLAVGDVLMALHQLGASVSPSAALGVRALACLVAAAVPWVPETAPRPVRRAGAPVRALPYLLVAGFLAALIAGPAGVRAGSVPLALIGLVVAGLAAGQFAAVRARSRLAGELDATRRRLEALVSNVTDVVLTIDGLGRVTSANEAAARLLHRIPDAMHGLDAGELAIPGDRTLLRLRIDDVVHGRLERSRVEVRLAAPATGTALLRLQSVPGGAVANLSDVTESVQLRERLERLARFDELTGLANRAHLLSEIDSWLRAGLPVAVLYCDLDGFKAVNDRFGHLCGDGVLVEAARRIDETALEMPADRRLVARVGGDEFVVALVGGAVEASFPGLTQRLLDRLRPTFQVSDRAVRVGLSIGVATSADTPPLLPGSASVPDADALLHRADVAMFTAKQAGRFRWMRWDAALEARALRRVDIAIGLRRALDSHRLAVAYQPLVRLSDGAVVGVEALLRVEPEDDAPGALAGLPELVSPAELVAVAEDTGEITEVGHWVLTEATAQAARWRALGYDVLMNVNVSVLQLETEGFVTSVRRALEAAGLPPAALVVEITEGQLLSEEEPAWGAVEQLRAMGVMLVIDDFGSGYSSLAYLRRMPVRGVKLDRAILADLVTDHRARTLARAIIAVARALGLLVVAEGLESLEAARIVRDLGAWAGQGFALFEAMPADDVTVVLAAPPSALGDDPRQRRPAEAEPEARQAPDEAGPPPVIDLTDEAVPGMARVDLI